jgi:hypothetical protein
MVKGYYLRVFPSGYRQTRVQVYVPKETGDPVFCPSSFTGCPGVTSSQRLGLGGSGSGDPDSGLSGSSGSGSGNGDGSGDSGKSGGTDDGLGSNDGEPNPQKTQDAINGALNKLSDWHDQYGQWICNYFAAEVAQNMGYNDFFDSKGLPMTANQICDFVSNSSDWGNIDGADKNLSQEIQDLAKNCDLVVGVTSDPDGHGHIVVVDPNGNLQNSGHAGGSVPNVYDPNLPNTPSSAANSFKYGDDSTIPKWYYRK